MRQQQDAPTKPRREFLRGLKVLEWGEAYTAPFCGKLLADLGADVVKLEELPEGDAGRGMPPFAGGAPGHERSLMFAYLNGNKRGIAINVGTKSGGKILNALLSEVDVLVTDRPQSSLERAGIEYAPSQKRYPGLIVTSITPFGLSGPYGSLKGYPSVSFHYGGTGWVTPPSPKSYDRPPLSLPGRPSAVSGGLASAMSTLMAVLARKADGQGRFLDLSETEAMLPMLPAAIGKLCFDGVVEPRSDRVPAMAPFDFYQVKDGWASMHLVQEAHWHRLLEMMGNPEWADTPMFSDKRARSQYKEDIAALMEPWLMEQSNEDLYAKAQAKDIPVGPARSVEQVLTDCHTIARESVRDGSHPAFGHMVHIRPPYREPGVPWDTPRPSPTLGEHTSEVLSGWLGLSSREQANLAASGVL